MIILIKNSGFTSGDVISPGSNMNCNGVVLIYVHHSWPLGVFCFPWYMRLHIWSMLTLSWKWYRKNPKANNYWHTLAALIILQMPEDNREFLCAQQKWLLQWPYLPQSHQGLHDTNWGSTRWVFTVLGLEKRKSCFTGMTNTDFRFFFF